MRDLTYRTNEVTTDRERGNRNPRFAEFEQHLVQCPACGSFDHDGWTNHDGCPEDWTVYSKFQARRWVQLTCERYNEEGQQ